MSERARPDPDLINATAVLRSRWDGVILGACLAGLSRFDDYRETLGISPKTLARRLNYLVDQGLVARQPYQFRPLRHDYRLTPKGQDLLPAFEAMAAWSRRWSHRPGHDQADQA